MADIRPCAPKPTDAQRDLIAALGGPSAVAKILAPIHSFRPQAVSMWARRGIPYRYRPALARAAAEQNVPLPENFLDDTPAVAVGA